MNHSGEPEMAPHSWLAGPLVAMLLLMGARLAGQDPWLLVGRLGWDDLLGAALVLAGAGLQRLASGRKIPH